MELAVHLITKLVVADILSIAVLLLGLPIVIVLSLMERTGRCYGTPPSFRAQLKGFLFQVVGVLVGVPISYLVSYALPTPHAIWPALAFPAALVVSDFLQYWEHRIEHHWLLWRIHAVHHSTREMTSTSNVSHFTHSTLMTVIYGLPIAIICGDPMSSISVVAFVYWWSAMIHSPAKVNIGALRVLLVDNRMHRIHHSLDRHHFDKNFGSILNVWDRIFGTYYAPGDEWPASGVNEYGEIETVRGFLFRPFI